MNFKKVEFESAVLDGRGCFPEKVLNLGSNPCNLMRRKSQISKELANKTRK